MAWHAAARVDDLTEGETLVCKVAGALLALYRLEGAPYATSARCTHTGALLIDAYVDDDCVECPLHQALFHIPTGECRSDPKYPPLPVFPVKVEAGEVFVLLPDDEA